MANSWTISSPNITNCISLDSTCCTVLLAIAQNQFHNKWSILHHPLTFVFNFSHVHTLQLVGSKTNQISINHQLYVSYVIFHHRGDWKIFWCLSGNICTINFLLFNNFKNFFSFEFTFFTFVKKIYMYNLNFCTSSDIGAGKANNPANKYDHNFVLHCSSEVSNCAKSIKKLMKHKGIFFLPLQYLFVLTVWVPWLHFLVFLLFLW